MKKIQIIIKDLGICDWDKIYHKMNIFTNLRNKKTIDEIWLVEHKKVFTRGQIENKKKIFNINNIPVFNSNRGGKITYHGPGQQIIYFLLNLKKFKLNIRKLLYLIEQIILSTLFYFSICSHINKIHPGIYIKNKKICSIGLRIKKYYCFHGCALNININLIPFKYINPCGNKKIQMTKMSYFNKKIKLSHVKNILIKKCLFFLNAKI